MSSNTRYVPDPPPPPPPQLIQETGMMQFSLQNAIGPTLEGKLETMLEQLSTDHAGYVQGELGLNPKSPEARLLAWEKTATGPGPLRQYSLTLSGAQLPPELRSGDKPSLTVHLLVGVQNVRIRHDYLATVPAQSVEGISQRLSGPLNRAVVQGFNSLLATTVSHALKQKAEERVRARLKQEAKLQTRITQNFNHQTVGLVETFDIH